jgi:hypothetical protein
MEEQVIQMKMRQPIKNCKNQKQIIKLKINIRCKYKNKFNFLSKNS